MSTNYKSELVGVFGHPVAENPTIVMQEAGFKALGLNWRYLNIEVFPEDLERAVQGLRAMNFAGINCTIPHKVAVLEFLDEVAPDARVMGAVNTVRREGDKLIGEWCGSSDDGGTRVQWCESHHNRQPRRNSR
jgi:shikimate dehydrogenase